MNEREHSELMKRALFEEVIWVTMTGSDRGREEVAEWLRAAVAKVRSDRKRKESDWKAGAAACRRGAPEWRDAHAAHQRWLARARGFEGAVVKRLANLGLNEQGHPFDRTNEKVSRAHKHAEYMQRQLAQVAESLADLASLVEGFLKGSITDAELGQALDDLTIPDSGEGTKTLRELLAAKRAAHGEAGA
jgi:hypothetical protein